MTIRILSGLLLALVLISAQAADKQVVPLKQRSADIAGRSVLGVSEVPDIGPVRLEAWRKGSQLLIHAFGPDGVLVGQAQGVPGMSSTPLYLQSEQGLRRLELQWGSATP